MTVCSSHLTGKCEALELLREELRQAFTGTDTMSGWEEAIWSFGPRHAGSNILRVVADQVKNHGIFGSKSTEEVRSIALLKLITSIQTTKEIARYMNSVDVAFQLVSQAGPLCEEPMMGVCFTVSDFSFEKSIYSTQRLKRLKCRVIKTKT